MGVLVRIFKKGIHSLSKPTGLNTPANQLQSSAPSNVPIEDFPVGSPFTPLEMGQTAFPFDALEIKVEEVSNMQCSIMMLDIIISQVYFLVFLVI